MKQGKLYKVELFQSRDRKTTKVDDIIVEKSFLGVREIVSGLEIDLHTISGTPLESIMYDIVCDDIERTGYYLFTRRIYLKKENLATKQDIEEYVDNYQNSEFNKVVQEIKRHEETRKKVKSKGKNKNQVIW